MKSRAITFTIIVLIVLIVLLLILLHMWELVKPYVVLARSIIRIVDIVRNFTVNVAVNLINLIRDVGSSLSRVFDFDELSVVALADRSLAEIDKLIDEKTINRIVSAGKHVVVTALNKASHAAINLANKLADLSIPVSLVLFDPQLPDSKSELPQVGENVHLVNVKSTDVNMSLQGDKSSVPNQMVAKNQSLSIVKPVDTRIESYINALRNGFI